MRRVSIILAATLFTLPALAFDPSIQMTGADFSRACTRANESWVSFCNGYVQATVDSLREADGVCIKQGTTRTDLVTIAEREITASETLKAMNAYVAVRAVMAKHHPCS